jgi:hypothetical protein
MLPAAKLFLKRSMQRTAHAAAAGEECADPFAKMVWRAAGVKRTRHTGAEKEAARTNKKEATAAAAAVLEPDARAAVSVKRKATEVRQKQAAGYRLPQIAGAAAARNTQSRAPPAAAAAAANVSAADINKASSSCCTAAGAAAFGAAAGPSAARLDCTPIVYGDAVTAAFDCESVNLLWPANFQQQQQQQQQQLVGTDSATDGRGVFQMLLQQARELQLVTRILQPKLQQQQQQCSAPQQQQQQQVLHLECSELLDENAAGSCLLSNSSSNGSTGFPSSRCVSVDAPAACSIKTAAAAAAAAAVWALLRAVLHRVANWT